MNLRYGAQDIYLAGVLLVAAAIALDGSCLTAILFIGLALMGLAIVKALDW